MTSRHSVLPPPLVFSLVAKILLDPFCRQENKNSERQNESPTAAARWEGLASSLDRSLRMAAPGVLVSHLRWEMFAGAGGGAQQRHCEVMGGGDVWGEAVCAPTPKSRGGCPSDVRATPL